MISGELKTIEGVTEVTFRQPNYFDVAFDGEKTSKEKILSLEVFKTYKATVVSESLASLAGKSANDPVSAGQGCDMKAGTCGCGIK